MLTGGAFEFGDGYINSVYVSTVQKYTGLHCIIFIFAGEDHIHVTVYYIPYYKVYTCCT